VATPERPRANPSRTRARPPKPAEHVTPTEPVESGAAPEPVEPVTTPELEEPVAPVTVPEPVEQVTAPESRLGRLRSVLGRPGRAIREESARPLTRNEKIGLTLLVAVPTLFTAVGLLSELTIPVPSVNDDSFHYLFIQQASNALNNGESIFDFWLPQIEAGFAQFFYYQHLPALVVVGLQRLSFGALDLLTTFNLVRYILLVSFPLTVFVSMRTMRFSVAASAFAAAASTLLSGGFLYGFEYDSYIWRGWGMYTQLWAMHLSFLSVATMYRAIHEGKRLWLAALLFGMLVLTHLIYAYMTAMAIVLMTLWGLRRSNLIARVLRLAIVGAFAAAISEYMWLPFLTQSAYLNVSPYLQSYKYDSYGAGSILSWVFTGDLLDHGRLPVLTVFLGVGAIAAILGRSRVALLSLALFVMWLVAYFGRPTLGAAANLFPLNYGLLFHRFIGGVDLAAIILIGVGGAVVWGLYKPYASTLRLGAAVAVLLLLLAPAVAERMTFYSDNTAFQQRSMDALKADTDANTIIATLQTLPPGRVFAGLPSTYGNDSDMSFGDLHFYNLLPFYGIESLAPPIQSLSLNSDYIWDFDDQNQGDFDLWNVRYMVAPTGMAVADFLTPIQRTTRYTLYQAPTTGFAEYVAITSRQAVPTQAALFSLNLAWERTHTLPGERDFVRYDYPATVPGFDPASTAPCPGGGKTDYERFQEDAIDLAVECPVDSTLVIKTTYHPDWQVYVDGGLVPDFMVSPSYIGISLAAGKHTVDAVYRADPIKAPLVLIGAIAALFLLIVRGRLDRFAERLGSLRRRKVRSRVPSEEG